MAQFLFVFLIVPLFGFLLGTIIPKKNEKTLSRVSFITLGFQFISVLIFTIYWGLHGHPQLYTKELTLYNSHLVHFEMFLDFRYDNVTAVFLLVGAYIAFLITSYSRNYLHREMGFKRFFSTIMFFYLGFNTIVLSGNLTSIFVGWEIAGIASFLLIAYYRNRYIPVKNALNIFSVYRLGDLALILAMWLSHHLWHSNVSLLQYHDEASVLNVINNHQALAITFSIFVVITACVKSAQVPFSSWLPRAMEGPTPSSAIFYTSLSVHLGVLLLLRTYPFWSHLLSVQLVVIGIGIITYVISTISSRVQPSIKGQIAYSVTAQVGLMFIEVALGWHVLVLIHFTSHALLRSYQLLVSPSIVTYEIRKQFYQFVPTKRIKHSPFIQNFKNSIYVLSLVEWYMDDVMHHAVWNSFKVIGKKLHKISHSAFLVVAGVLSAVTLALFFTNQNQLELHPIFIRVIPVLLTLVGLMFALRSFTEKKSIFFAWRALLINHILIFIAMMYNKMEFSQLAIYFGGVLLSYVVGLIALKKITTLEEDVNLNGYQGHCYEHPKIEILFFLACIGIFGFPITSTFLGIELVFGNIQLYQIGLVSIISLSLLVSSLSVMRMYSRIFLGPHVKTYHESARRSS